MDTQPMLVETTIILKDFLRIFSRKKDVLTQYLDLLRQHLNHRLQMIGEELIIYVHCH